MSAKIDLKGQRFGRLIATEEYGHNDKQKTILWKCLCDCGKYVIVSCGILRSGHTKSCGCLKNEKTKERSITHGMSKSPEYNSWSHILARCNNINNKDYHHYGGRGITICDRWLKFENFFEDMGKKPKGLTIERIDNDKGYYKKNCKWDTQTAQVRNQRLQKTNKTGVAGVGWHKRDLKYHVSITAKNKQYFIGYFDTLEQAKMARKHAERLYWGKQ